jgi:hypothetical protein
MTHRLYGAGALALGVLVVACSAASSLSSTSSRDEATSTDDELVSCTAPALTTSRSLFVSGIDDSGKANPFGTAALASFPFRTVMDQIVASGAEGTKLTSEELFEQMISAFVAPTCTGEINGFPVDCNRPEALLVNPTCQKAANCEDALKPVALVNRFDLAPANGANCGQYRIVFAPEPLPPGMIAFFTIFEAVMPNPTPSAGLAACAPVAKFWEGLSAANLSQASFVSDLSSFYFKGIPASGGLPAFPPVIAAAHYGIGSPSNKNTGQLRTNAIGNGSPTQLWQLREFRLHQSCKESGDAGTACTLSVPETMVQDNPFGALFNVPTESDGGAQTFQTEFLKQVASLAGTNANLVSMTTPNVDNAGQSDEQDETNDYAVQAGFKGGQFPTNTALEQNLQKALGKLDSGLTPENIVDRATSQSCAGCHQLSPGVNMGGPDGGFTWPQSNGFTQVQSSGAQSPALTKTFLPFRKQVLASFLQSQCSGADAGAADPDHTVGGQLVGASN